MYKAFVLVGSFSALAGVLTIGCSSSSGSSPGVSPGSDDGGTPVDTSDSGLPRHPISAPDASNSVGDDSGAPTGDAAAAACSPADESTFVAPAYVPAIKHAGQCTAAQITAFATACSPATGTPATCSAFRTANTACLSCIVTPSNATSYGAFVAYPNGALGTNIDGCIELTVPTTGPACAASDQGALDCIHAACDTACGALASMADFTAYDACALKAQQGTCASIVSASTTACASISPDAGASSVCFAQTPDLAALATLFCGP